MLQLHLIFGRYLSQFHIKSTGERNPLIEPNLLVGCCLYFLEQTLPMYSYIKEDLCKFNVMGLHNKSFEISRRKLKMGENNEFI